MAQNALTEKIRKDLLAAERSLYEAARGMERLFEPHSVSCVVLQDGSCVHLEEAITIATPRNGGTPNDARDARQAFLTLKGMSERLQRVLSTQLMRR